MIHECIEMMGKKGRDRVTGYTGVCTSVAFDLYGCVQVSLTPERAEDAKWTDEYKDGRFFDVNRIEITDHNRVMEVPDFDAVAAPTEHPHGPDDKSSYRR